MKPLMTALALILATSVSHAARTNCSATDRSAIHRQTNPPRQVQREVRNHGGTNNTESGQRSTRRN